jgi:hypothetical protein
MITQDGEQLSLYAICFCAHNMLLTLPTVRNLQVEEISLRWFQAKMQTLRRAWRRMYLPGAWHQA